MLVAAWPPPAIGGGGGGGCWAVGWLRRALLARKLSTAASSRQSCVVGVSWDCALLAGDARAGDIRARAKGEFAASFPFGDA